MAIYNLQGAVLYAEREISRDWYLGADLIRKPLTLTYLGDIPYKQAFCRYNGKYYCTDGAKVAELDEGFRKLREAPCAVGHGNAMQLGSGGIAYVSGWDDQTVYKVDLSNLSVAGTITLPTTGYTTCAVDDVRKLIYIWQRESRPNTEEYYNFIVYDYDNEEVLSTVQTTEKFGAMQSVDLFTDVMIVLNGLGTAQVPNGFRIYDRSGKVLSEYVLGSMASAEPEGVCVDRESREIYISFNDGKVYRLE